MKSNLRFGLLLLSVTALLCTLIAQTESDLRLLGKWKLNTAKSQYQNAPFSPVKAVLVISAATLSHFKWKVTIAYDRLGNNVRDYIYDGAIDGKPYDYRGFPAGTKLSYTENKGTLEGTATFLDGGTQHETITVSSDGDMMTAQCIGSSPVHGTGSWTEVWERVPDKKKK
jgi:hypothetical protein